EDVAAGPVAAPPGAPPIPLQAPAHCRVDGIIGAHRGPNGKPYGIRFALALPPNWNGRLLYQGGGGLNGSVQAPVGMTATGDGTALARGFAVVTSDSGREAMIAAQRYPEEFDGIVVGSPAMRTNYSNLATRWITVSLNSAAPKDAH